MSKISTEESLSVSSKGEAGSSEEEEEGVIIRRY
jgi:hypothetical protein